MGGDNAPSVVLDGVAAALTEDENLQVVLVGPADVVEPFASTHNRCTAAVATEVIGMAEHPAEAVRKKKDSSIVIGCKLVKEGKAQGFFSAGSTGACLAGATLGIGRIKGVSRPCLCSVIPSPVAPVVMADIGANADCKPEYLAQFAQMASIYAEKIVGIKSPKCALLNIGEEDTKGSQFAQAAFAQLKEKVPNFVGNCEGRDIIAANYDVVITDGFTGNVVLKTIEGTSKTLFKSVKKVFLSNLATKLGALAIKGKAFPSSQIASTRQIRRCAAARRQGGLHCGPWFKQCRCYQERHPCIQQGRARRCVRAYFPGGVPMTFTENHTEEQKQKVELAQKILGYEFKNPEILLAAITHPSATEGKPVKFSYERLEFLGDSILGAVVASEAFHTYHEIDEGGLTRIKVALVSGASLSDVAEKLGFADIIVFGSSERGTGRRGLHSALENVYEAVVAALYLDAGIEGAQLFIERTLIPRMSIDMAKEPENPKSALQEKLQEEGITPTYKLIETQGPPHDRTFVSQVFAGMKALASGMGRTKKEAESQAAKTALDEMNSKQAAKAEAKAAREQEKRAKREKREPGKACEGSCEA